MALAVLVGVVVGVDQAELAVGDDAAAIGVGGDQRLVVEFEPVLAAYVRERLKRLGNKPDTRWRPVGMDRLARDAALDPDNLARWQQAQVLYVEHGPQGRVKSAYTSRPD